jgi:hypothetical protein
MIKKTLLVLVAFLSAMTAFDLHAQTTPTEVYQHALTLEAEIDLIRLEMGVPARVKPDFSISDAQPREVYFQALTLFEKSNRLLFEQVRLRESSPAKKGANIEVSDVFDLIDGSLRIVLRVKQSLGIVEAADATTLAESKTPTDVYRLIVRLNRMLNRLLRQRFAPAEVYEQLTYGVGLESAILATVSTSDRLGTEPALVRRKTPVDVYRKLISIYMTLHDTLELSGEKCLVIKVMESEQEDIDPSDVYDMASLLVAQLSYMHSLRPNAKPPKDSYYPGDKLPSHAYQRAGRLESQLNSLHRYVSGNPAWLEIL